MKKTKNSNTPQKLNSASFSCRKHLRHKRVLPKAVHHLYQWYSKRYSKKVRLCPAFLASKIERYLIISYIYIIYIFIRKNDRYRRYSKLHKFSCGTIIFFRESKKKLEVLYFPCLFYLLYLCALRKANPNISNSWKGKQWFSSCTSYCASFARSVM